MGVLGVRVVVPCYLLSGEDQQFGDLRHDTIASLPGPPHRGYVSTDELHTGNGQIGEGRAGLLAGPQLSWVDPPAVGRAPSLEHES